MGLLDILNGMQNGPRGQRLPGNAGASGSGKMSPLTMALIGLLAYKALKHFGGGQGAAPAGAGQPAPLPPGGTAKAGTGGGGLGSILGGMLGGAAAGSV